MADVFVSYKAEDRKRVALLVEAIESDGLSVWWDAHIGAGDEWRDTIQQQLDQAKCVVVVWSKRSIGPEGRFVRDEASRAQRRNTYLPVRIDKVEPPLGFGEAQALALVGWKGDRTDPRCVALLNTARSIVRDGPNADRSLLSQTHRPTFARVRREWFAAAAGMLILILVAVALWIAWSDRQKETSIPSIALLPLAQEAPNAATNAYAAATRDSLSHALSDSGFLVRMIATAPSGGGGGDLLISGEVRGDRNLAKITVRVEDAASRDVIYSRQFEAVGEDVKLLPERVGAQIAAMLPSTQEMLDLEREYPSDPATRAELLRLGSQIVEGGDTLRSYEIARQLALRQPNSAHVQRVLAYSTAFALWDLPRNQRDSALAAGRTALDRAQEIAPNVDYSSTWCHLHSHVRMAECEDRLRKAMRTDPAAKWDSFFLSGLLDPVGRSAEALELARLALANDRYKPWKIARVVRLMERHGLTDEADELYRQGNKWWPNNNVLEAQRHNGILASGRFDELKQFGIEPNLLAAIRTRNVASLNLACSHDDAPGALCMLGLAHVGDYDGAFRWTERLYPRIRGRTPAEEQKLWLDDMGGAPFYYLSSPAAVPLRRDPRFLLVAERVGLLDYWRTGRLPDFCKGRPEPVCAQLGPRGKS